MKTLVSKGLVAAAVATACTYMVPAEFASAATLSGGIAGTNHSREGLAAAASTAIVTIAPISYVSGTTMIAGDRVRLTIGGSAVTATATGGVNPADTVCGTNGTGQFSLEFAAFSGNTATFLVKDVSGTTNSRSCAFLSLGVLANSISSSTTVSATSGKAPFGSSNFNEDTAAALVLLSTSAQYSLSLQTALNGIVDYTATTNSGLNFSTGDDSTLVGNEDILQVKLQTAAGLLNSVGTAGSVRFTLTAAKDFKFLDNNGDGTCTAADLTVSGAKGVFIKPTNASAATYSINSTCTVITVESTGSMPVDGGEYTLGLALGRDTAAASVTTGIKIEPQDFANTSVVLTRSTTGVTTTSATYDAGEWTQNGASYIIPYMPYNSSATNRIDPTLYVTNRGTSSAVVTASARNESGVACTDMALGSVNATSTRNVGPNLATALDACYGAGTSQRLYITVNVATASGNTEVYSGFNVGGSSRVSVTNSSNGK